MRVGSVGTEEEERGRARTRSGNVGASGAVQVKTEDVSMDA